MALRVLERAIILAPYIDRHPSAAIAKRDVCLPKCIESHLFIFIHEFHWFYYRFECLTSRERTCRIIWWLCASCTITMHGPTAHIRTSHNLWYIQFDDFTFRSANCVRYSHRQPQPQIHTNTHTKEQYWEVGRTWCTTTQQQQQSKQQDDVNKSLYCINCVHCFHSLPLPILWQWDCCRLSASIFIPASHFIELTLFLSLQRNLFAIERMGCVDKRPTTRHSA